MDHRDMAGGYPVHCAFEVGLRLSPRWVLLSLLGPLAEMSVLREYLQRNWQRQGQRLFLRSLPDSKPSTWPVPGLRRPEWVLELVGRFWGRTEKAAGRRCAQHPLLGVHVAHRAVTSQPV